MWYKSRTLNEKEPIIIKRMPLTESWLSPPPPPPLIGVDFVGEESAMLNDLQWWWTSNIILRKMENLYVDETIYFREKYREDCASRYQFVVSVSKEIASSACSRICYEKRPINAQQSWFFGKIHHRHHQTRTLKNDRRWESYPDKMSSRPSYITTHKIKKSNRSNTITLQ